MEFLKLEVWNVLEFHFKSLREPFKGCIFSGFYTFTANSNGK